jgi:UDP-N-acetylmuramate dehydrogenase
VADLSLYNTLGVGAKAGSVTEINSVDQVKKAITDGLFSESFYILGRGANVLFTRDITGPVFITRISGEKIISQTDNDVFVEFGAGKNWAEAVSWAADHNWSGMENMAGIPGSVGAAAAGNIAAYGGNQQDIFDSLTAVNLLTGSEEKFDSSDMKFAYRDSIFKNTLAGKYFITSVTYKLSKVAHLELSYHASRHASLLPELEKIAKAPYQITDVVRAITNIRNSKLPDVTKIHTAGSFFKNPVVTKDQAAEIKKLIPDLQIYPSEKLTYIDPKNQDNYVKIPAGMLLDELGWRGKKTGKVGTSPNHALVIVADQGATGREIYAFSESMRSSVKSRFGLSLEYEVVVI